MAKRIGALGELKSADRRRESSLWVFAKDNVHSECYLVVVLVVWLGQEASERGERKRQIKVFCASHAHQHNRLRRLNRQSYSFAMLLRPTISLSHSLFFSFSLPFFFFLRPCCFVYYPSSSAFYFFFLIHHIRPSSSFRHISISFLLSWYVQYSISRCIVVIIMICFILLNFFIPLFVFM